MKTTTLPLNNSTNRASFRFVLLLIPLALACFALSPQARATCQEGCDTSNSNTFLGDDALVNNTTGSNNTAIGFNALFSNTAGYYNTAIGWQALYSNTTGADNAATGLEALFSNTHGFDNTADGSFALSENTTGNDNTATGENALKNNRNGGSNTADGVGALSSNRSGSDNTATGGNALLSNTTGVYNTANGVDALLNNKTGSSNIAVGFLAGSNLTGDNNIDIGNIGVVRESKIIRIGTVGVQMQTFIAGISGATVPGGVGVIVGSNGQLGTMVSSARFKEEIEPMDKASEAILGLKPVTFHYKKDLDPAGIPQFGLVAEEVEKVNPALVARDEQDKPYTVRYEAVNAMLLNEFLKEHRKVEVQQTRMEQQDRRAKEQDLVMARQQKEIEALAASLKKQAAQIQKASEQLELRKAPTRVVANE